MYIFFAEMERAEETIPSLWKSESDLLYRSIIAYNRPFTGKIPNWTKSRVDKIQNWQNPELEKTPNGQNNR